MSDRSPTNRPAIDQRLVGGRMAISSRPEYVTTTGDWQC